MPLVEAAEVCEVVSMTIARRVVRSTRRAIAFGLVPAMSLLTLILVVPIVARLHGESGVVAVSVGQSIGAVLAIVVSLGWPLSGPSIIARGTAAERSATYQDSIDTRIPVFLVSAPVGAVLAALLLRSDQVTGAIAAVAFTALGFSNTWYYGGKGVPRGLLLYEAFPRLLATACAGAALLMGLPLPVYPLLLLGATLTGAALVTWDATGTITWRPRRAHVALLRSQMRATVSRLGNSIYLFGATPIIAVVAPTHVFVFSIYDRVSKSAFNAAIAFPGAFINTVASEYPPRKCTQRVALMADVGFALLAGLVLYVGLPLALTLLYGQIAVVVELYRIVVAASFALALLNRCLLVHGLYPLKDDRRATDTLGLVSLAGVVAIGLLSSMMGVIGAFVGILVTELVMLLLLTLRLFAVLRRVHNPTT
jgi:hypothetical protein